MKKRIICLLALFLLLLAGCSRQDTVENTAVEMTWEAMEPEYSMELLYADQFCVD